MLCYVIILCIYVIMYCSILQLDISHFLMVSRLTELGSLKTSILLECSDKGKCPCTID